MRKIAQLVGLIALGLVIVPPLAFMLHVLTNETLLKVLMLIGTIMWFVTAPIWMRSAEH